MDPQTVHLPNWVRQKIAEGSIHDVVDKKLLDNYDATHLQTVIDLAMNCLENASIERPSMTEVVSVLKVCLPALSSEKQSAASTTRRKNIMDAEIPKQFQLMISGASTTRYEGSPFQSVYTGAVSEISDLSGRQIVQNSEVAVMEVAAAPLGVRTRARALAMQRPARRPLPTPPPALKPPLQPHALEAHKLAPQPLAPPARCASRSSRTRAGGGAHRRSALEVSPSQYHSVTCNATIVDAVLKLIQSKIMAIVYDCLMSAEVRWLLAFQLMLAVSMTQVHADSAEAHHGFLSIDCGLTNSSSYNDSVTNLTYISDSGYAEGGKNHNIMARYMEYVANDTEKTLRNFPDGQRNCYTLPSTSGKKYLIRTTFTYGNYDGLNSSENGSLFLFGLHIDVNFWTTVNLTNWASSDTVWKEVITVAPDQFISVCLINFGSGTPFVSALDLRPLHDLMYPFVNTSVSVSCFSRLRFGSVDEIITRYPVDKYDRFWESWYNSSYPWLHLSTTREVRSLPGDDKFQVPSEILQKASTINSNVNLLYITVKAGNRLLDSRDLKLLPIFYFAELNTSRNMIRLFNIWSDGEQLFANFSPSLLQVDSMYQNGRFLQNINTTFTLRKQPTSQLPPLINAFEVYSLVQMDNFTTDSNDVNCTKGIKKYYNVRRNWNGDPCSPIEYSWEGLTCNYGDGRQNPRVTRLNLSSSGLRGGLAISFMKMASLENLDLSHNNLTGTIPDYQLNSLRMLDLSNNQLNGPIPGSILQRFKAGQLELRYHATFQLTVKADVYSFGIVLLEIITGQPSVLLDPQPVHLPNWVRQKIATGSIHDAVDSRLLHEYDATSLQSIIDLAMNCVENASIDRPSMTDVVSKLKECLPATTTEKQLVSGSYRQKDAMDTDIARRFQPLISEVSIELSNEGNSSVISE
ncbi:hypothetical protein ABZP36_016151 [Zizania latifolia]